MSVFEPLRSYAPDACVAVGDAGSRCARDLLHDVAIVGERLAGMSGELLVSCTDRYHLALTLLAAWQHRIVVALPPNGRETTLAELAERCARSVHDGAGPGDDVRGWLTAASARRTEQPRGADAPGLAPIEAGRWIATIYTSGSTGEPSACQKTAQQLLGESATLQRAFALDANSTVLASVPAHHIYGFLFSIGLPWAAGARFVRETPLHMPVIDELARRYSATDLVSVPAHLHALAQSGQVSLASVRRIFSSGAPLPNATAHELHRRFGVAVSEILGSTETGGFAWRAAEVEGAPFRPFPGVRLSATPEQQLLLASPLLDPRIEQPLACADRIDLHEDGSFHHLGRVDSVVKVGGTRVALNELEARVRMLSGVRDAAALVVDAAQARGQELWLVVATENGRVLPELREHMLGYYEPVVLPRRVRFVDDLPREATGKLPRARLLALFTGSQGETTALAQVLQRGALEDRPGGEGLRVSVVVPTNLVYFEGHFPGHPILPGIAQLETLVLDEVERRWPDLPALRSLARLKWKSPVLPGQALEVELVRSHGRTRVDFTITRAGEACAQGTLEYGTVEP